MVSLTVQFLPRAAVAFPAGPADGRASSFRDPVAVRAGLRRGRVRHGGARGGRETLGRDQEEGRGGSPMSLPRHVVHNNTTKGYASPVQLGWFCECSGVLAVLFLTWHLKDSCKWKCPFLSIKGHFTAHLYFFMPKECTLEFENLICMPI